MKSVQVQQIQFKPGLTEQEKALLTELLTPKTPSALAKWGNSIVDWCLNIDVYTLAFLGLIFSIGVFFAATWVLLLMLFMSPETFESFNVFRKLKRK